MQNENKDVSLEALQEIRSIMDRSARFISLSGWSGIWAGCTALAGAAVAYTWMQKPEYKYIRVEAGEGSINYFDPFIQRFLLLAAGVFAVALVGGIFFTYKKASRNGQTLWNNASRQMLYQAFFPLFAAGVFIMMFIYHNCTVFIAPACLVFYGLALISASRHTLSDIRYLGILDIMLGSAALFLPRFGLYFWAFGFGVLHILYGAIMWNKYDK